MEESQEKEVQYEENQEVPQSLSVPMNSNLKSNFLPVDNNVNNGGYQASPSLPVNPAENQRNDKSQLNVPDETENNDLVQVQANNAQTFPSAEDQQMSNQMEVPDIPDAPQGEPDPISTAQNMPPQEVLKPIKPVLNTNNVEQQPEEDQVEQNSQ